MYLKALSREMEAIHGDGMIYEMDKWYHRNGKIIPCENGYHFCDCLKDLRGYYDLSESRIFEVEVGGQVIADGNKFVTDAIRLVRELSREEIRKKLITEGMTVDVYPKYVYFASEDELDELVHHENWRVRCEVAKHGRDKDLDVLVSDKRWEVRLEVAKHGRDKDLDILVSDKDEDVRREVARYGRDKDLDILVSDEDWEVRLEVARHGRDKDLDILVSDEDWEVRNEASQHK